jgi:hypothetical protein
MKPTKMINKISLIVLIAGIAACTAVGDLNEETKTVQLGEAKSVELRLEMGAGELKLQGGAQELLEGYFRYNVADWKPKIEYSVVGNQGILKVSQGSSRAIPVGKKRNHWDISLKNDVPLDVEVKFGAGQGNLDLRGLTLNSLEIEMGVGELIVDLTGERKKDLEVSIEGGIGSGTVFLPHDIGVRAKVEKGIGAVNARGLSKNGSIYTNDAYGKAEIRIDIDIEAGIGSIDLIVK